MRRIEARIFASAKYERNNIKKIAAGGKLVGVGMWEQSAKIEFRSVGYGVGETEILNGFDLDVYEGETMILLGESGCGKTTTLKMVNRLIEPTAGEVRVDGIPTTRLDPIELRRRIGYVLQEGGLMPHLSVAENVGLVPELAGWASDTKARRTSEMLELVGLDAGKFGERFPHELSGGQRQRVGLARALAADPDLLLLDEPFGALDAITRNKLQREFAQLARSLGKTAIFVTHDLHEGLLLGSRIALMDRGQIVLLAPPDEFVRSNVALVRQYLETIGV